MSSKFLFMLMSAMSIALCAQAEWKNWINNDPITDLPRANAQVKSNEIVNYHEPTLYYSCELTSNGEIEQRIQILTREIHQGEQGQTIFRIDFGDPMAMNAENWGDYSQAPTIVRLQESKISTFESKADQLSTLDRTLSNLQSQLDTAQDQGNGIIVNQIQGKIKSAQLARAHLSSVNERENSELLENFDALVEALQNAKTSIVVRTSEVTFTVPTIGSMRTIEKAKTHCGL